MDNIFWEDFMEMETLAGQLVTFTSTVDSEMERLDDWRMGYERNHDGDGKGVCGECVGFVNRLKYLSQLHRQELERLQTMIENCEDKVKEIIRAAKKSNAEITRANDSLSKVLANQ